MEHVLSPWRQRSLSYSGKYLIINALVLSRVWYVASLIHVPRWVSIKLNSLIFKFFWSGKRDLLARRVVVQDRSLGGFFCRRFSIYSICLTGSVGSPVRGFSCPLGLLRVILVLFCSWLSPPCCFFHAWVFSFEWSSSSLSFFFVCVAQLWWIL